MEEQRIRQQMEKLGNTEFQWESLNIEINGKVFVPVKVLNEVRRRLLNSCGRHYSVRIVEKW